MRDKLEQYVQLLFAGAANSEDIQQEILQNTLDRYDDLIREGKVPEAAYRLAIAGIGDINEILGTPSPAPMPVLDAPVRKLPADEEERRKRMRAIAVGMYIVSAIPVILFSTGGMEILGLCLTLCIVAAATVLIMLSGKQTDEEGEAEEKFRSPLEKSIHSFIWTAGIVLYLALSFITQCWHLTWLVFPICSAVWALIKAIIDYKEAAENET